MYHPRAERVRYQDYLLLSPVVTPGLIHSGWLCIDGYAGHLVRRVDQFAPAADVLTIFFSQHWLMVQQFHNALHDNGLEPQQRAGDAHERGRIRTASNRQRDGGIAERNTPLSANLTGHTSCLANLQNQNKIHIL